MKIKFHIMSLLIFSLSCEAFFFDDDVTEEPLEVYDAFIDHLENSSPYFRFLQVDIDSVFETKRKLIQRNPEGHQLISSITEILDVFEDAHTRLEYDLDNNRLFVSYLGWMENYPLNELPDISPYFEEYKVYNRLLESGKPKETNIGYIKINTFSLGFQVNNFREILSTFEDTDGLILDIRSTNDEYLSFYQYEDTKKIIELFSDSSRVFLYNRNRVSTNRMEFADWQWQRSQLHIAHVPAYTKPVIILTNRRTKDKAEYFTAGMRVIPNNLVIGDTTAGFIGAPQFSNLVGKWYIETSVSEFSLPETYLDDSKRFRGIPPDITVHITPEDSVAGIDTILERAIQEIAN